MHKVNMNLLVSKKYKTQISRMIQILVCTDDKRLKIWGLKLKGGRCQCKQAQEDESGCTNVKTDGPHVNRKT